MRVKYKSDKLLSSNAKKNNCLSIEDIQRIYPNPSEFLTLWLRGDKLEGSEIRNEKKIRIEASLIRLECNQNYSTGLFTFINKHTSGKFQLDIKYYGRLWWIFK